MNSRNRYYIYSEFPKKVCGFNELAKKIVDSRWSRVTDSESIRNRETDGVFILILRKNSTFLMISEMRWQIQRKIAKQTVNS